MTSRKLEMRSVQVLDSDWFKTDHRAVRTSVAGSQTIPGKEWLQRR